MNPKQLLWIFTLITSPNKNVPSAGVPAPGLSEASLITIGYSFLDKVYVNASFGESKVGKNLSFISHILVAISSEISLANRAFSIFIGCRYD
ncbi:hypothetical protein J6TS2_06620 [Heyndrickxia sporothermodurans]|nr:hypothetical protein J6TS2_06620 [Heyndrickxia sporothermodurans]